MGIGSDMDQPPPGAESGNLFNRRDVVQQNANRHSMIVRATGAMGKRGSPVTRVNPSSIPLVSDAKGESTTITLISGVIAAAMMATEPPIETPNPPRFDRPTFSRVFKYSTAATGAKYTERGRMVAVHWARPSVSYEGAFESLRTKGIEPVDITAEDLHGIDMLQMGGIAATDSLS